MHLQPDGKRLCNYVKGRGGSPVVMAAAQEEKVTWEH